MNRNSAFFYLIIWFLSLTGAYYFGARQQNAFPGVAETSPLPSESGTQARQPANAQMAPVNATGSLGTANRNDSDLSLTLETALDNLSALRPEVTRQLLAEAFARPASDPNRPSTILKLLSDLAEDDPEAALEMAAVITSLRENAQARAAILEVWGQNDPAAALRWARMALADEPLRSRSAQLSAIYRGYAAVNPQAAFNQALALDESARLKNRLLNDVIETQIKSGGVQNAITSLNSVTDSTLRPVLLRGLIGEWASLDPQAAVNYLGRLGEEATPDLKSTLVTQWAEKDPPAAAAWLTALGPEDPTIARGSAAIIREWTRYDLAASAEWLNSLPATPELDRAVASYAFQAAEEDPETAMTWAESIENDRRRSWMMERVASSWLETDAESFQNYLNSGNFTEEQRNRLENARGRGPGWGR